MKITVKKLADLHQPEKNVRMHTPKQIAEFKRSVEMFGQIRPMVIDENGLILAGNGLFETLKAMGKEEADCYVVKGLSEKDKKKLMLSDNKIFSLGIDVMDAFEEILAELEGDTDIPGYDPELLETLTADLQDVDELIAGYGTVDEPAKEKMTATAQKYEAAAETTAKQAEEIKPAPPPAEDAPEQEKLDRRFIVCPKCGNRIWL